MQEKLVPIFNRLKILLKKHEGTLVPKFDLDSKYDLWSLKEVEVFGRKKKEVFFAAIIIQSSYVGFYFSPVEEDQHDEVFEPELLGLLKGVSCFHIKSLDKNLEKQITRALKRGYQLYKKNGWI
ncbi:MAG: DUF1801 domain-containing protein [Nitrospinales bacterium]